MSKPDHTNPKLTSLTLPTSINVTQHDKQASFTAGATDKSGVESVQLFLDHGFQSNGTLTSSIFLSDATDSFADNASTSSYKIDSGSASGTYNVTGAMVYDKSNNWSYYDTDALKKLGVSTSFAIKSDVPSDTTDPVLKSLTLPKTINASHGDKVASFTAGATDTGIGVDHVELILDRPFMSNGASISELNIFNSADSFSDGKSTLSLQVDSDSSSGTYHVLAAEVFDKAGNYTVYDEYTLRSMHFRTIFTIKGEVPADTTDPVLTSLTLPKTVDVTHGNTTASFTIGATDKGFGVDHVYIELDHGLESNGSLTSGFTVENYNDSFDDGTSTYSLPIDSTSASGLYKVAALYVVDAAGNSTYYSDDDLKSLGMDTSFRIKSDTTASAAGSGSDAGYPTETHLDHSQMLGMSHWHPGTTSHAEF